MTVVVLLLLPVLVRLGFWQLGRAEEKQAILADVAAKQSQAPRLLVAGQVFDTYTPVTLMGRYLDQHFLIDNKVLQGRVGYEVLSVFEDEAGVQVLVNRGFIEGLPSRQQLPNFTTPAGRLVMTGSVSRNLAKPFLLAEQAVESLQSPMVIQAFEPELMSRWLPTLNFDDAFVRLDEGQPSQFEMAYQPVNVNPEKHSAYALQWFAMSLALIVLYLLFGFGKLTPKRGVSE